MSAEGEILMKNLVNGSGLKEHVETITEKSAELESRLVRPAELAKNLQYFYRLEGETGAKLGELRQVPLTNLTKRQGILPTGRVLTGGDGGFPGSPRLHAPAGKRVVLLSDEEFFSPAQPGKHPSHAGHGDEH